MKSSNLQGAYKTKETMNKNNLESMPKIITITKNTMNSNQESGTVQKQTIFNNLTLYSDNSGGAQTSVKTTDRVKDIHPWRKGTISMVEDSLPMSLNQGF